MNHFFITKEGDALTFRTGSLMCLFGVFNLGQAIFLGSEMLRCLMCYISGLKFGVGEIIWSLIFLVCHCPSHFLSIKFFFVTGQLII